MSTTAPPRPALTQDQIEAAIASLPPVYRVMMRLLLLQYLDPASDDITFMAGERSEPNNRAGGNYGTARNARPLTQPKVLGLPKDWIVATENKVNQFRSQLREQRERLDLLTAILGTYLEGLRLEIEAIEQLLTTECEISPETLDDLRSQAKMTPVMYTLKKLALRAEKQEIEEEEYVRERLSLEYQAHIRRRDRFKRRLEQVSLERQAKLMSSLSDEFLATIWGIAKSPITDRRVKAVQKYIQALAGTMKASLDEEGWTAAVTAGLGPRLAGGNKNEGIGSKPREIPGDLWSQTLLTLAGGPVSPSAPKPCGHDGGRKTLASMLRNMAAYTLSEDDELKLWTSISQCLPCLRALRTAQHEAEVVGIPVDVLLIRVKTRTALPRKEVAEASTPQIPAPAEERGELVEQILKDFIGDDAGQVGAKSWW